MSMYNQVRNMEPYIRELVGNHDLLTTYSLSDKQHEILKDIEKLSLKELRILKTVMDIGESGRGRLTIMEKDGDLKDDTFFKIEINEKAEIILSRFSKLLMYNSRNRLLEKIVTNYFLGSYLLNGLEVLLELKTIHEDPSETKKEEWFGSDYGIDWNLEHKALVQIIETGIKQDSYKHFLVEVDVAENIEVLKEEFITWIQEGDGLYPHRMVHRNIYDEKIVFEGYVYNYDGYDFIDWINAYRYESLVAAEAPIAAKTMDVSKVIVF
ncbi:hypothetical protein B9G55_08500 [Saccharibacillus sp. O16]|nr:hypothetical protein B9G55_08500 [Saccharibacillus sp. O16]